MNTDVDFDKDSYARTHKLECKLSLWDSFQDPPSQKASGSAANWTKLTVLLKLFKLFIYVFVFVVTLIAAVISKISFVFMTAQVGDSIYIPYCNQQDPKSKYIAQLPTEKQVVWVWALIFAFSAPELFTFLRSLRFCIFKDVKSPTRLEILLVTSFDLLHVIGLALLTFWVMPQLDSMRGLMLCSGVSFTPAVLNIFAGTPSHWRKISTYSAVLALAAQSTAFVIWPIICDGLHMQLLVIPLILVSLRWWENYINAYASIANLIKMIHRTKSRYHTYLYLSPLKIVLFTLIAFVLHGQHFGFYFTHFTSFWREHDVFIAQAGQHFHNITKNHSHLDHAKPYEFVVRSNSSVVGSIILVQVASSYVCYIFAKFACKIQIQEVSCALPLCLASPLAVAAVVVLMYLGQANPCLLNEHIPSYLSLNMFVSEVVNRDEDERLAGFISKVLLECHWIWLLWWLSQLWITHHMWRPKNDKNLPTEKLFICPWYCGFLVEQCITLNRRIMDWNEGFLSIKSFRQNDTAAVASDVKESDRTPQLIVCATMWHETQEEMMEFLKSIIRLDEDQCARRMAKVLINDGKPDDDYYELETNIFFDDAFILDCKLVENAKNPPLNEYVKILITSVDKAMFEVYGVNIRTKPPVKIETPYGGRLVWTLPGRSKMIAHLKNKDKIRHKKRWSQVMYMYYLLGFRIMELDNVSIMRKAVMAKNTFLLALDGDIDFQPHAVTSLINRMKAIDELGAACGRIHPVGRGPMVWYQVFEYAIGHWLQKATEHVIGCVLCSPGCFSLFRGSALMENGVIKKYTTVSQEPMHYVQYDQGEDRWLCTLILKQGLRVEYSAASDAYTHSPEIFNEFYNQRRRWIPSTLANIFDLLADADIVIKNNNSISRPYIAYQAMLMVGTVLGPGTIFLMMVGALVTVFSTSIWTSFIWNFIPILTFILSCIYLKQKCQLLIAFVISTLYCLVMMTVLIGIIIQMIEDGPWAPASVFFLLVFGQIFIAGIVHPQEVGALVCGLIYYITIPSMYMLLLIYSVFNMNDVSWGVREVAARKTITKDDKHVESSQDEINNTPHCLPGWINDPALVESELGEMSLREKRFWKDLIRLYLKPLFHTKEKKAEIADSLRELRNVFAFAFVMINSIFVLVVFLLQLKKDYIHLKWPIDPEDFINFDNQNHQIFIYRRYKELDPIGLSFVIFFGFILIIQFIAMFIHRFATISQLLASTQLNWFRSSTITDEDAAQEIRGNAVHIARQLQRPKRSDENEYDFANTGECNQLKNGGEADITRRSTVFKLHELRKKDQYDYSDLPRNFERRFLGDGDLKIKDLSMSRKSVLLLNETRFVAKRHLAMQTDQNAGFNRNASRAYSNEAIV